MGKPTDLPLDNLSPEQRKAFQTHLDDLWDDYQDELADLTLEAKQLAAGVAWDNFDDPLRYLRTEVFETYADRANQAANDYYDAVRSAWAEAAGVELPAYTPSRVSADRAFWQIVGGYNSTDHVGLKFVDVINHRSRAGLTMDDLWATKTDGYGEDEWMNLAADIVGTTARLTSRFNAEHDPAEPRYARVPVGPTCAFCILMASRGFVYWSEEKAGGRGNRYHQNDDCRIVSSWGESQVKGYDPDGMKQRYKQCRATISGMLNRNEYDKYVAEMKAKGRKATEIDKYDEWTTHRIVSEMGWRDRQWLYDGSEPSIEFASDAIKAETQKARPQEIRTAERARKFGIKPLFQLDYKEVENPETHIMERVGLSDWAGGIEIKTPDKAKSFRSIDGYLGSAGKKPDATRLIIDNSENPNMSDEQVVPGFLRTLVFARLCDDDQFAACTV
ncbi:hypothetical protein, partial [Bifidobacterium reuteri]|uniref:VG15 protein n=1 Tax=Bifidobacterium reuteri TaxID=983706 RepID=UPI00168BB06C